MSAHHSRAPRFRSVLAAAASAVTVAALTVPVLATSAGAAPTLDAPHRPSAAARSVGIDRPGQAYMGWSARRQASQLAAPQLTASAPSGVRGIDVSSHQGNVDWSRQWSAGKRFAYVKATEGTGYHNPYFAQQYVGSYDVGMTRGAYHFALPNVSSGATQANYFVDHGGGWSRDGKTLPGVLDIEYNPYSGTCYGMSRARMRSWISSFVNQYRARTGRDAIIYTTTDWWRTCTGNTSAFSGTNPLWIARYAASPGTLPGGWSYHTFWQYASTPMDQDVFNGSSTRLRALALG
ncbi:MAG TPA: lysozyme [Segeticoccus sp.]|uniref:lysozyme n=1 Tax=Segeticoccus sp. TaxID=2706531 RepID=UPI002D7FE647|nr:lysozyme [Segeticoccus sp.]HET8601921.1 lysozyme [Segeticoccus sp.]